MKRMTSHLNTVNILKEIYSKSVEAVRPENLIRNSVRLLSDADGTNNLEIRGEKYPLSRPCYVVGFGKAVLGMALAIEQILGRFLHSGVVTVPAGIFETDPYKNVVSNTVSYAGSSGSGGGGGIVRGGGRIRFVEGAKNNVADEKALEGALEIKKLAEKLTSSEDLLLVLISGGGSALLPLPKPPVTLAEKTQLIRRLGEKGADIGELNTVRKCLSLVKNGGLARLAHPARIVSLILSDVVNDPLDVIASGPTFTESLQSPSSSSPTALDIVQKYLQLNELPKSIKTTLKEQTASTSDKHEINANNLIIGNNSMALEAAKAHAVSLGFQTVILSNSLSGDVTKLGEFYAKLALNVRECFEKTQHNSTKTPLEALYRFLTDQSREISIQSEKIEEIMRLNFALGHVCVIGGGEPTVIVSGSGKGGRNQQLALEVGVGLGRLSAGHSNYDTNVAFLSAGTDGIDGPTDAAGAISTEDLLEKCRLQNIAPLEYLAVNDSYGFYERYDSGDFHIKIGHTGTNVMDVHVLLIDKTTKKQQA